MDNNSRLLSIDTLRGFDMFFIMGVGALINAIAAAFPCEATQFAALQMEHVKWNGFAFIDMIFPLFLFISGISFPFSCEKNRAAGMSDKKIYLKIIKRAAILVFFGMVYNGFFKLDFEHQRWCSVLGRIGIAWAIAAAMYVSIGTRKRVVICGAWLLAYWLILGLGGYEHDTNFAARLDRILLPGVLYETTFEPAGPLTTLGSAGTAMLGIFAGEIVRSQKYAPTKRALQLAILGALFIVLGLLWNYSMPINKKLWTSSYICFAGGISFALFSIFYYVIDVKKFRKWTFFFAVIGMNSITVYMAQRIVGFGSITKFFGEGLVSLFPPAYGKIIFCILYIATVWLFLLFLYRKRIFLKV